MPQVQFNDNAQGLGGQGAPAGSPEQVRKKWDALLNVINNVSADSPEGGAASQAPPLRAARELVNDATNGKSPGGGGGRRREWDDRHHLMFSVVNGRMQKNIRSYFDRHRDIEAYGLRYDEPLRTIWQLDTPEDRPAHGTLRGHYAKFQTPEPSPTGSKGGGMLPMITDPGQTMSSNGASPNATGMSKTMSDPGFHASREQGWNARHNVVFAKDNHHYHSNLREYFERPRSILW